MRKAGGRGLSPGPRPAWAGRLGADLHPAGRQCSGALGVGLCQVAVHLNYASRSGQALVDRALYSTRDWAADYEHRELTGVPDELASAGLPLLWTRPRAF